MFLFNKIYCEATSWYFSFHILIFQKFPVNYKIISVFFSLYSAIMFLSFSRVIGMFFFCVNKPYVSRISKMYWRFTNVLYLELLSSNTNEKYNFPSLQLTRTISINNLAAHILFQKVSYSRKENMKILILSVFALFVHGVARLVFYFFLFETH